MNEISNMNWLSMSDQSITQIIGKFVKHHRLDQNRTQTEVARDAGMSRSTFSLLERGENVSLSSLIQALRVLDLLYIMENFKVSDQISPIEYAKLQKNKRQRARDKNKENDPGKNIEW